MKLWTRRRASESNEEERLKWRNKRGQGTRPGRGTKARGEVYKKRRRNVDGGERTRREVEGWRRNLGGGLRLLKWSSSSDLPRVGKLRGVNGGCERTSRGARSEHEKKRGVKGDQGRRQGAVE